MKPPRTITITIDHCDARYVQLTAFNRFIDNVRRALHGDEECRTNLLAEDLVDAYHHYTPVFRAVQDALNTQP